MYEGGLKKDLVLTHCNIAWGLLVCLVFPVDTMPYAVFYFYDDLRPGLRGGRGA